MSFSAHLENIITQVDGSIACSVMGFDGIAIETCRPESTATANLEVDLDVVWVEFANVFSQLNHTVQTLKTGHVTEVCVQTTHALTLMHILTAEYFLALGLLPGGNYGKARYVLRIKAGAIRKEL